MKLIDVSVPLDATLPNYPGNTPFSLEAIKRLSRGDRSNVSTLHMSAHGGTHVDAPRHFFDDGPGTEALPLEMLIGRTRVIEVASRKGVTADDLSGVDLSVEEFKKPGAPAHHVLLGAGTIVIEGLNLRDVEPGIYEMHCLPLRIVGSDGAPARVVLRRS